MFFLLKDGDNVADMNKPKDDNYEYWDKKNEKKMAIRCYRNVYTKHYLNTKDLYSKQNELLFFSHAIKWRKI